MPSESEQLIQVLRSLPSWESYPYEVKAWTPTQIQQRFPVWELWPDDWRERPPGPAERTWCVYGQGALAVWGPEWSAPVGARAPESLGHRKDAAERVLRSPATVLPNAQLLEALVRTWREVASLRDDAVPEVVCRNEWEERKAAVAKVSPSIRILLNGALREVRRSGARDTGALEAIERDELLHSKLVGKAIGLLRQPAEADAVRQLLAAGRDYAAKTLAENQWDTEEMLMRVPLLYQQVVDARRKAEIQEAVLGAQGQLLSLPPQMTGIEAADVIGVNAATLSRWQSKTPIWAKNAEVFTHLLERDRDRYYRDRVLRLARWFRVAQEAGGQTPVDCP